MTLAPSLRAASITAARVSRRLASSSSTDRQIFELVSICARSSSLTTLCGVAFALARSKIAGAGSAMTSRVAGSMIISSSSIPRVMSIVRLLTALRLCTPPPQHGCPRSAQPCAAAERDGDLRFAAFGLRHQPLQEQSPSQASRRHHNRDDCVVPPRSSLLAPHVFGACRHRFAHCGACLADADLERKIGDPDDQAASREGVASLEPPPLHGRSADRYEPHAERHDGDALERREPVERVQLFAPACRSDRRVQSCALAQALRIKAAARRAFVDAVKRALRRIRSPSALTSIGPSARIASRMAGPGSAMSSPGRGAE